MRNLFLQMLRVSVGIADSLSDKPTEKQWLALLKIADKQALLGVFFYAIQRLPDSQRPNQNLFLEWMACAAKIKERNYFLNQKCVEFQRLLTENNFKSAILKGQGNCTLYPDKYSRQSGDIDIWIDSDRNRTLDFVKMHVPNYGVHEKHVHFKYFDDVQIELHDALGVGNDPFRSNRFVKWFAKQNIDDSVQIELPNGGAVTIPNPTVNLFFQLEHIYHHLLTYGIGLRQIMDYYFLLIDANDKKLDFSELRTAIDYVGLNRFVSSLMFVLNFLFSLDVQKMPLAPNAYHGKFLLEDIMRSGNFGRSFNQFFRKKGGSKFAAFFYRIGYYFRLGWHFPVFAMVRFYCYLKGFYKKIVGIK